MKLKLISLLAMSMLLSGCMSVVATALTDGCVPYAGVRSDAERQGI